MKNESNAWKVGRKGKTGALCRIVPIKRINQSRPVMGRIIGKGEVVALKIFIKNSIITVRLLFALIRNYLHPSHPS